jgi:predicted AlkP superfamily phosphohydrolase/phosphomutase
MFGFLRKEKKRKIVVLGIDGVPCSLLRDFLSRGVMPNFASIVCNGTLSEMTASIPEVSSTSWTTCMTGVNPGKHNIYGFMDLKDNSYEFRFPNSYDVGSETIWEMIGKKERRSVVLNVPSTYPAKPLNGILTAGFVALDLRKATFPESAYHYLKSINYRMDADTKKAAQSIDAFAEDIRQTFITRKEALLHFFDNEAWDLFIGTITETDRLHHFLWSAYEDDTHPVHGFFLDFYREIDTLIGELVRRCDGDTPFIIVSDHGFASIKQEVYLNTWLREEGFLKFRKEPPESLSDLHPESKAFALDPSRIYINLKNRYPSGSVKEEDYESVRTIIKTRLQELSFGDKKVVKEIFFKEDIYHGPYFSSAPDLVALPHHGYDLKGSIQKNILFGKSIFTGAHTRDDATFFLNRAVNVPHINIMDITPTIVQLMGIDYYTFDGKSVLS